jgi:hypothetical protein
MASCGFWHRNGHEQTPSRLSSAQLVRSSANTTVLCELVLGRFTVRHELPLPLAASLTSFTGTGSPASKSSKNSFAASRAPSDLFSLAACIASPRSLDWFRLRPDTLQHWNDANALIASSCWTTPKERATPNTGDAAAHLRFVIHQD